MTLTIKLDGNWSSFQLANSAPPLSVTDSALAPSAGMLQQEYAIENCLLNYEDDCAAKQFRFAPQQLFWPATLPKQFCIIGATAVYNIVAV